MGHSREHTFKPAIFKKFDGALTRKREGITEGIMVARWLVHKLRIGGQMRVHLGHEHEKDGAKAGRAYRNSEQCGHVFYQRKELPGIVWKR